MSKIKSKDEYTVHVDGFDTDVKLDSLMDAYRFIKGLVRDCDVDSDSIKCFNSKGERCLRN